MGIFDKKRIIVVCFFVFFCQMIFSQSQKFRGYPQKDADILSGFSCPPKGYGNVPFYWWNGDSLNRERMKEQLEILSESATDGFAVSYLFRRLVEYLELVCKRMCIEKYRIRIG